MRFDRNLIHRCTLVNPGQVIGKDPYGRDIVQDVPIPDVHCRIDQIKRRVSIDSYGVDIIVENILFLGPSQQLMDLTKVKDINDQKGNTILSGTFTVENINPVHGRLSLHHYEVTLKKESD